MAPGIASGAMTTKVHVLEVFAARLREARHRRGFTQIALAAAAGLHPIYLARLEREHQNPTLDVVVRLAHALDVPVADLVPRTRPRSRRARTRQRSR
jgi:transcriptional regulator with XRE-family HTH domain